MQPHHPSSSVQVECYSSCKHTDPHCLHALLFFSPVCYLEKKRGGGQRSRGGSRFRRTCISLPCHLHHRSTNHLSEDSRFEREKPCWLLFVLRPRRAMIPCARRWQQYLYGTTFDLCSFVMKDVGRLGIRIHQNSHPHNQPPSFLFGGDHVSIRDFELPAYEFGGDIDRFRGFYQHSGLL